MKKISLVAFALLFASTAFASKSRVLSLQGADFLTDTQTIFENPAVINYLSQQVAFEFGNAGVSYPKPRAEGGFIRNGDNKQKYGFYMGHQNRAQDAIRYYLSPTLLPVENSFEAFYGANNWGGSVYFSNSNKKSVQRKQTLVGGRIGAVNGATEYFGTVDVVSKAKEVGHDMKMVPTVSVGVKHDAGHLFYKLVGAIGMGEDDVGGTASDNDIKVYSLAGSVADRIIKTQGHLLYYGVGAQYTKIDYDQHNYIEYTIVPVFVGLEQDLNDWLVARASIQQSFLLSSVKNHMAANNYKDTIGDDTTVSAGFGAHYKNFTADLVGGNLDASANVAGTGHLFVNASAGYTF